MRNQYRLTLAALLIGSTPLPAAAAGETLENVLVTGTLAPRQDLTSTVSVIDTEQIAALHKRSVTDLLKTLPGLLVEEQGGAGGLTAVSVRGGEANFTLVLLDGVPVNDPTNFRGGSFDFTNLNPALVDRIEVVRGPQSAVYGSDALAGVINIITRRPADGHQQQVRAEAGEDDYGDVGLSAFGRSDRFEYSLEAASRDYGDPVPGSERDSDSVNLRAAWRPWEGHRFDAAWRYLDGDRSSYPEQSGGPQFATIDALDHSDYEDTVLSVGWEVQALPGWRSALTANRFEHKESYRSPGIPPFFEVPPNAADTDFTRDEIRWVNTVAATANTELSLGADYRDENGESTGVVELFGSPVATDFELDRGTLGLFTSVATDLSPELLLQGSARYDDPEGFDSETSLQAGFRYAPGAGITLRGNWGEAYKLPSFFALGNALVGNPDLVPETARGWDAGIAWDAGPQLRLEANYFFNDFKDLVDFDDETFRNVNRQNVETAGVEIQVTWQPASAVDLAAQATYTDIDVQGEDTALTGRPEWTAGVSANWKLHRAWRAVLDYRYTGEQLATSRHTGEERTQSLDDFHRVDGVLHWQGGEHWQLQLSVDNLLDEDYVTAVGFTAPGRSLRLGVTYSH